MITANGFLAPKPAALDLSLRVWKKALSRMDVCQAELEMLQLIELARDFMTAIVQNRTVLKEICADCVRIRKLRSRPRVSQRKIVKTSGLLSA